MPGTIGMIEISAPSREKLIEAFGITIGKYIIESITEAGQEGNFGRLSMAIVVEDLRLRFGEMQVEYKNKPDYLMGFLPEQ